VQSPIVTPTVDRSNIPVKGQILKTTHIDNVARGGKSHSAGYDIWNTSKNQHV